jgi:hypothetical protein
MQYRKVLCVQQNTVSVTSSTVARVISPKLTPVSTPQQILEVNLSYLPQCLLELFVLLDS